MNIKTFQEWKKAIEKMTAHEKSDIHIQPCEAELAAARVLQDGPIIHNCNKLKQKKS